MNTLFDRISVSGLTTELHERIKLTRRSISRNTVILALHDDRAPNDTTSLRTFIRNTANALLNEMEDNDEIQQPATNAA